MEIDRNQCNRLPLHLKIIGHGLNLDHTVYHIEVNLSKDYSWTVLHRYRDFHQLHEQLVAKFGISNEIFPPRKLVGNLRSDVIQERKESLQKYLDTILAVLPHLPRLIADFIAINKYNILSVCRSLSSFLYKNGDRIIAEEDWFELSPFQLYCINQRLLLPLDCYDGHTEDLDMCDIGHLYSFLNHLEHLRLNGSGIDQTFKSQKDLFYDLSLFKSLKSLEIFMCDIELMTGIGKVQQTVKVLTVMECNVVMKDLLIGCESWKDGLLMSVCENNSDNDITSQGFPEWCMLQQMDLSHNCIQSIDFSLKLVPKIKKLNLSCNLLTDIEHIKDLPMLTELDLSYNHLQGMENFEAKLCPSIQYLSLAGNHIKSIADLSNIQSLEHLDLSNNDINDMKDILKLGRMKRLRKLDLRGNSVTTTKNYRISMMSQLEVDRELIILDGRKPSHFEMRKISELRNEIKRFEVIQDDFSNIRSDETEKVCSVVGPRKKNRIARIKSIPNAVDGNIVANTTNKTLVTPLQNDAKPSISSTPNNVEQISKQNVETVTKENRNKMTSTNSIDEISMDVELLCLQPTLQKAIINYLKDKERLFGESFLVTLKDEDGKCAEHIVSVDLDHNVLMQISCDPETLTEVEYPLGNISQLEILDDIDSVKMSFQYEENNDGQIRQHIQYQPTSMDDAAALYAMLRCLVQHSDLSLSERKKTKGKSVGSFTSNFDNPFGFSDVLLMSYFQTFLQGISNERRDSDGLHGRIYCPGNQDLILSIWASCLPYNHPENEFPVCLVITNLNIHIFHFKVNLNQFETAPLTTLTELYDVLSELMAFSISAIKQITVGLYDQAFRIELKKEGTNGTTTFVTRDAACTSQFLEIICSLFSDNEDKINSKGPTIVYPDEKKINMLQDQLMLQNITPFNERENLIAYCLVYHSEDFNQTSETQKRSLILTNSRVFLCEEDHVHWPPPTFVRKQPTTPNWVVDKNEELQFLVGIDVWQQKFDCYYMGSRYGVTMSFEDKVTVLSDSHENVACKSWPLLFHSLAEREQFTRSLSCLWSNRFDGTLVVTKSNMFNPNTCLKPVRSNFDIEDETNTVVNKPISDILESISQLPRKRFSKFCESFLDTTLVNDEQSSFYWTKCPVIAYNDSAKEFDAVVIIGKTYVSFITHKNDKLSNNSWFPFTSSDHQSKLYCLNIPVKLLTQIVVGLFDQTIRIESDISDTTFVLVIRSHDKSSLMLQALGAKTEFNKSIAMITSIPEFNYYSKQSEKSQTDNIDKKPSLQFVYPCDDVLEKLNYYITEHFKSNIGAFSVVCYTLAHVQCSDLDTMLLCSIVITETMVCLIKEDYVHYPLPLFSKELPDNDQYVFLQSFSIDQIVRIEFSELTSFDLTFVIDKQCETPKDNSDDDGYDIEELKHRCSLLLLFGSFEDRESVLGWLTRMKSSQNRDNKLEIVKKYTE